MKSFLTVAALVALVGCNGSSSNDKSSDKSGSSNPPPHSTMGSPKSADTQPSDTAGPATQASAKPVNTICPICGEKVDPKLTTVYKGKVIGFGCAGCPEEFQKDPERYANNLK